MKVHTSKQGAVVSSPRGYRAVAYPHGSTQGAAEDLKPRLRDARRFVRDAALRLGLGARGEVYGGEKFDSVVYACRVAHGFNGRPTIHTEDV